MTTTNWKPMNKTIFDLTAGFSVIGMFNGFFDKVAQLHIDWGFILQAVLIQVLVIVFRLAFSSFWKKYGKKWVGLSSLLVPVLAVFLMAGCSTPKFTGTVGATIQPDPVSADSIPAVIDRLNPVPADPDSGGTAPEVFHGSSGESRQSLPDLRASADTVINGVHIKLRFTLLAGKGWFSFLDVHPPKTVSIPVELKQDGSGYRVTTPEPAAEPSWYASHPVEVVAWSVISGILLTAYICWRRK